MSNITKFGLQLPQIGTSGNWGSAVNQNFIKVADEIQKIYQAINSAQSLIGANIPYINVEKEQHYFVSIYYKNSEGISPNKQIIPGTHNNIDFSNVDCILNFYGEDRSNPITYYHFVESNLSYTAGWNPVIPMFIASYVLDVQTFDDNGHIIASTINDTTGQFNPSYMPVWHKSDILVAVPEFGSIYGDNYSITFKSYLPMGEYYVPSLQTNPYELQFTKVDFVTWHQTEKTITYTLPAIGLGVFNNFTLTKVAENEFIATVNDIAIETLNIAENVWSFEVTVGVPNNLTSVANLRPIFNWYAKQSNEDSFSPIFVAHAYNYEGKTNENICTFTIEVDITNLQVGETFSGDISFVFRDGFNPCANI